ncbi:hypothetical protein TSUD_270330 [Trifolium subterraneum]|uniref:Uncharacterized protein n=1 Tax=Trifolium subterraneum TaxID=3900 RepID=A0A2Z6P652_TRISU|nr:hypothetical protein TSUD_270330 [Trifolium subterraneum]
MRTYRVLHEVENQTLKPDVRVVYLLLGCLVLFNVAYWLYRAIRKCVTPQTPRVAEVEIAHATQNPEPSMATTAAAAPPPTPNRLVHIGNHGLDLGLSRSYSDAASSGVCCVPWNLSCSFGSLACAPVCRGLKLLSQKWPLAGCLLSQRVVDF